MDEYELFVNKAYERGFCCGKVTTKWCVKCKCGVSRPRSWAACGGAAQTEGTEKEMRFMKEKALSEKEKLFCTYYSVTVNAVESAYKAGYTLAPERAAIRFFCVLVPSYLLMFISSVFYDFSQNLRELF